MSLKMYAVTECDCDQCKAMCHSPCCGTPDEIRKIIDAGYGGRLCLDDWPNEITDLHPALKGYEGKTAPYQTMSREGCTFWIDGKCELHDKGLKPSGGKLAHHAQPMEEYREIMGKISKSWLTKKAMKLVHHWKRDYLSDRWKLSDDNYFNS
jgi:hypothetical protein